MTLASTVLHAISIASAATLDSSGTSFAVRVRYSGVRHVKMFAAQNFAHVIQ